MTLTAQVPASTQLTVGDLINKVKAALQNRNDVAETAANPEMRPSAWIRDTLKELTANYPFPDLQVVGPLVSIGPGLGFNGSNYAYPVSSFLNAGDDATLTEDPVIFLTPGKAQSVNLRQVPTLVFTTSNLVAYSMDYLTPKAIQPLLFIPGGIPFRYTRYGNQFWFGTQPGSIFNTYLPYQVRHPFDENNLTSSPLRIPSDWLDVAAYGAAERGAIALRWNDQATFLHNLLYGDPLYQSSGAEQGRPGLIAARVLQPERDRRLSPVMITPGAYRY
jgi:hypothetical protein